MKKKIMFAGLLLVALSWLPLIVEQGHQDLTDILYNWLYQDMEYVEIRVTKLEDLSVEGQICRIFKKDCKTAIAVVRAENGTLACDRVSIKPNSDGTIDRGLWQLNSRYHPFITDCLENTKRAYEIYKSRGNRFTAWSAFNNGVFKKFIN